jgi:hypothetical protein
VVSVTGVEGSTFKGSKVRKHQKDVRGHKSEKRKVGQPSAAAKIMGRQPEPIAFEPLNPEPLIAYQ